MMASMMAPVAIAAAGANHVHQSPELRAAGCHAGNLLAVHFRRARFV